MLRAALLFFATLAVAAASPAAAQPAPPIAQSWFVAEPAPGPEPFPTHFALGPNPPPDGAPIARARLLPNVLAELAADVPSSVSRELVYRAGSQWFQLARQSRPTFCSLEALDRLRHHCLIDSDADGLLDAALTAHSLVGGLPLLNVRERETTPLPRPVGIRLVPREQAARERNMYLVYIGRRRMTRRDASFMLSITDGRGFASGTPIPLFLDALPSEAVVGGVRFVNIVRRQKIIEFDVAAGFTVGPFEPYYGGHYTEWGF